MFMNIGMMCPFRNAGGINEKPNLSQIAVYVRWLSQSAGFHILIDYVKVFKRRELARKRSALFVAGSHSYKYNEFIN